MDGIGKECEEVNQRMAQLSQRLDKEACIQLYSDPSYFYQQWSNDMDAMTEIEKKK